MNLTEMIDAGVCTNQTIREGFCYGMAVCGYCYDFGEYRRPSREYEIYNLMVIGVAMPLIGVLGLIGDVISAFIYSRRSMASSLNRYLCALAFSDITIILTAFFLFFLESMRKRSAVMSKYFALFAPFMFPLGLTAQTLSVFLTVAAAVDCCVMVATPKKFSEKFCKTRTAQWVIGVIIVLACLFNSPHLFEIYVITCWSVPYHQPTYDVCPTDLRQSPEYLTFYYAYLYTIVMAVGPVVLLVAINSTIVIMMRRAKRKGAGGADSSDSDVTTLVLVVFLFISCNVL
uniref:G_PROTEIN_RECEP_F1_2 domain-containing protein n=1 Tax=Steinernema glaseri TaxID=37863 RepID=A0A1I7YVA9_9BILA